MATRMLRRGLPRVVGGEPWPPATEIADAGAESADADVIAADAHAATASATIRDAGRASVAVPGATDAAASDAPADSASAPRASETDAPAPDAPADRATTGLRMRRGLPRVAGGEPWPPSALAPGAAAETPLSPPAPPASARTASAPGSSDADPTVVDSAVGGPSNVPPSAVAVAVAADAAAPTITSTDVEASATLRRGLPRTVGGDPWPPADTVPRPAAQPELSPAAPTAEHAAASTAAASINAASATASATGASATEAAATAASSAAPAAVSEPPSAADATPDVAPAAAPAQVALLGPDLHTPLRTPRTVWDGRAPRRVAPVAASPRRRPTWPQAIAGLFGAAALGILAAAAVAFVRTLLSFPFMQDFLVAFPGEYESPIPVEPGFAPWVGWQHFFNVFLMVLIIRTGLRVRTEKRPTAFWTPRNNPKGKISLTLWFHQALDILWLVNGVVFVVLLIVTGHWVRIVPTSWEVFPNALSAALQYVSFDWPHENGWNNYNSLQQLAYFATVFIAAPLAAITGFRMSGLWPKKAERLSKAYPVEWARALHFPIMLYFVAFIIAHVALVMLTGFLRNLNHMYASQDAVTWTGFWVFVASMVVIAAGWFADRPLVIAPIAKAFGNVSAR